MANEEDVKRLLRSVSEWNFWREQRPAYVPKLSFTNLTGASLIGADLSCAYLVGINLTGANLKGSNLSRANLSKADLTAANLADANLSEADLSDTHLVGTYLGGVNCLGAIVDGLAPASIQESLLKQGARNLTNRLEGGESGDNIGDGLNPTKRVSILHLLQTISTATPLPKFNLSLCSLFVRLPPVEQRRNDFDLAEALGQDPDTDLLFPVTESFDSALKALLVGDFSERSAELVAAITKAIAEDHAIIGIRNPVEDLGPILLGNGFSVGSVVRLLVKGVKPRTVMAGVFLIAAGMVVIHLSKGVGRGLEKGGEDIALAICERIAENIRRPDAEAPQASPEK
jgi:uncharacterized protein YjbI with pentapeptide repeats